MGILQVNWPHTIRDRLRNILAKPLPLHYSKYYLQAKIVGISPCKHFLNCFTLIIRVSNLEDTLVSGQLKGYSLVSCHNPLYRGTLIERLYEKKVSLLAESKFTLLYYS